MARNIKVRGVRRKQIDDDKLALAFLLLAKLLHDQQAGEETHDPASNIEDEPEAA